MFMLFLCYVMLCVFFVCNLFGSIGGFEPPLLCCSVLLSPILFFVAFFSPLGMPLTAAESSFKNWLESESCVQYWIVDPSRQQLRLLKTWTRAQIEYDRIKEKEKQSNLHKEKPIE